MAVAVQAIIHHQKLVAILAIILGLRPYVLKSSPPSFEPGVKHSPNLSSHPMPPANIMEHKTCAGPKGPSVISHPRELCSCLRLCAAVFVPHIFSSETAVGVASCCYFVYQITKKSSTAESASGLLWIGCGIL